MMTIFDGVLPKSGICSAVGCRVSGIDADGVLPGICSEPYYGYFTSVAVFLTSQPKETMLLTIVSSLPAEAGPDRSLIVITPDDWTVPQIVSITSTDDPLADGDKNFTVTVSTLLSNDRDYGSGDQNKDGRSGLLYVALPFRSLDDPDDTGLTKCPKGYKGLFNAEAGPDSEEYADWKGCSLCPAGSWVDQDGDKMNCRACPPGMYGLVRGAPSMHLSHGWDLSRLPREPARTSDLDPGCLPCPNGTYGDRWGATTCIACNPFNESCDSLATVTPLPLGVSPREYGEAGSVVTHHWKLLSGDVWAPPLWLLPIVFEPTGHEILSGSEEHFQYLMILIATGITSVIFAVLMLIKRFMPRLWHIVFEKLKKLDRFAGEHLIFGDDEEDSESATKHLTGAFFSVTFLLVAVVSVGFLGFFFLEYNFQIEQALVPKDKTWETIVSDYEVNVEFVGYAGCVNGSADLNGNGRPDTEMDIEDMGLACACEDGVMSSTCCEYEKSCKCVADDGYVVGLKVLKNNSELPLRRFDWVTRGSYYCQ